MRQPIKNKKNIPKKSKTNKIVQKVKKKHPQYGTSQLEKDFARDFLDKLGVEYVYQFEAKDIGRFFDFYIPKSNLIIEIDGDYWHGNPDKYTKDELKNHQKKTQRIDEYKTKWALMHSIPILRIWESDIRKKPNSVIKILKETLNIQNHKQELLENKRKRH